MSTIKGPMHIKGFNVKAFINEKIKDAKIKLPFKATGWKSTKIPEGIDYSDIEFAKDEPKKEIKKKVINKSKTKKVMEE